MEGEEFRSNKSIRPIRLVNKREGGKPIAVSIVEENLRQTNKSKAMIL